LIRNIVFWIHLCVGSVASLVILMMSITGVLLSYEHQIRTWSLSQQYEINPANENRGRLPLKDIFSVTNTYLIEHNINRKVAGVIISADETDPYAVSLGKGNYLFVNPFTATILGDHKQGPHNFFDLVWRWHRWFNLSGDSVATGRAVTGAANLGFLFLILSGLYLWLPKIIKWQTLRAVLFFNTNAMKASRARDYNWHHVFGIWSAVPLIIIIATATLFHYTWATDLLEWTAGKPDKSVSVSESQQKKPIITSFSNQKSLDELFLRAQQQLQLWNRIQISLPSDVGAPVSFIIDQGNGRQPQKRHELVLHAASGEVTSWIPFSSKPRVSRWRSYTRYLHTGEVYGWFGQTIAAIVSMTSAIMVWTGLALAYRRLIRPLLQAKPES